MAAKNYKILSLDGGGAWALIQAITLADIYGLDTPGRTILNCFDLAIANSGGSIVLAGLIADMSPRDIFTLFDSEDVRKSIFVKNPFYKTLPNQITGIGAKYRTDRKLSGLIDIFYRRLNINASLAVLCNQLELKPDIVICAFDYDRERAKFFRSNIASKASGLNSGGTTGISLLQAVHASSTAPVKYFDEPAKYPMTSASLRFWDGAIGGYNNPALAGVVEALANGLKSQDIGVLSIGTGSVLLPLNSGASGDARLFKEVKDRSYALTTG
jgi:patatin-like phospholipase/acyl hydrolase